MSATAKDLNYYLSHTDEMPTDPKEIERLANEHMDAALEAGTEQMDVDKIVGKADVPGDAAAKDEVVPEPKAEEPVKPAAATEKPADAKPEGILSKDGKNVIPYSQLENARHRATTAEALAKEQATELAALRAARNKPVATPDADILTEEELSALEADSPTLAKTLRAQQSAIEQLKETVQTVTRTQKTQAEVQVNEIKSEIQTAIDANPTLAGWQTAGDQTLWNEASRIDRMLRESPKFANISFADRFNKVVEMTQVAMDVAPDAPMEKTLTPVEIKAAAQARLAQVQKAKKPVSLSDIPGGAPPAVDERQKVEEMSAVALGNQFLGMTKDQMDAYLSNL